MAQRILGVDIGTYSVKAVRLKSKVGGGYEYMDSYYEPVDGSQKDGFFGALTALDKIVKENGLENDHVLTAVSANDISSRFITLPFSDRKKIDQVIDFEIENYIPFSSDEIIADYQIASRRKDGADILAQVVKKSDLEALTALFKAAGIEPKYIDSEMMSLFSVLSESFDDIGCRAILDIGHNKSIFTVMNKRRVAYSHTIDFGGARINKSISESLGVSLDEADKIKRGLEKSDEVDSIIKASIDELCELLRRHLISFEMTNKVGLEEVLITGGTSNIIGIDKMMTKKLGIDFKKFKLSDLFPRSIGKESYTGVLAAYGIALRSGNKKSLSAIDFRADKTTSKSELKFLFKSLVKVFVMAAVLMLFYGADLMIKKRTLEETLSGYERRIMLSFNEALPDVMSKGNEILLIKESIKEAEKKAERIGGVLSKGVTTLDMLNELSLMISKAGKGEEVEIYECDFDGKRLNILGETGSYNLTDEIKKSLEASDMFKEVKMEYAKFTADQKKVKFSMKIALKEKVEK